MAERDWVRVQTRVASQEALRASRKAFQWHVRLFRLEREERRLGSVGGPPFAPSQTLFARLPLAWQLPQRLVANEQACQGEGLLQMQLPVLTPICAKDLAGVIAVPHA